MGPWGRDWSDFLAPTTEKSPGGPCWGHVWRCSKVGELAYDTDREMMDIIHGGGERVGAYEDRHV